MTQAGHISQIIRAARAYLGWTQETLSRKSDVTQVTIQNVESGKHAPNERTLRKIREPLEAAGIIFTAHGFEFHPQKTILLDDFMDILNDAGAILKKGDEILFHCADEARNTPDVTDKFTALRKKGIKLRFTICEGNKTITGPMNDYRWIDKDYFAQSEVEVTYADRYVQHFVENNEDTYTLTKNKAKASSEKKKFEYWWNKGEKLA